MATKKSPETWAMRRFGPGVMQRRPVIAIRLAEVSNTWATVEAVLAHFIEYMISEPYLSSGARTADRLGLKLFAKFTTLNQRWGLLTAVLESRLAQDEIAAIKGRLTALKKKLESAARQRNDLIHSIYGIDIEYETRDGRPEYSDDGDYLLKSKPYSLIDDSQRGHTSIDSEYIESIIKVIQDARNECEEFSERIKDGNRSR